NFSFGDYFKAEAIAYAWEFLTKDLGLPRERLTATVFTDDDEAFGLWQRVAGLPPDKILRLGEKDNFWAMGDTGPCGPCSEIHFHQGEHLPCAEEAAGRPCLGPACECDRWLEVWNLVFMQFNRDAAGAMTPLPKPSIDTGMGLERVAAIMQGKSSNFETDLLWPILEAAAKLARKTYRTSEADDISLRVIADHARAATFLIADGVYPSNEWRGYVLRRIMRRAMRHGRLLGLHEPFLWQAAEWVVDVMAPAYPEPRLIPSSETRRRASTNSSGPRRSASPRLWTPGWRKSRNTWRRTGGRRRGWRTASSSSPSTTPTASPSTWLRRCSRRPAGRCPRRAWTLTRQRWSVSASAPGPGRPSGRRRTPSR
ncbi:MAG: hypothetical protein HYW16_00805, partial [Candidatus Rokubacteria bacterium]|nr:hypothetical protein [Candidatus Rokubacteria bacterium]